MSKQSETLRCSTWKSLQRLALDFLEKSRVIRTAPALKLFFRTHFQNTKHFHNGLRIANKIKLWSTKISGIRQLQCSSWASFRLPTTIGEPLVLELTNEYYESGSARKCNCSEWVTCWARDFGSFWVIYFNLSQTAVSSDAIFSNLYGVGYWACPSGSSKTRTLGPVSNGIIVYPSPTIKLRSQNGQTAKTEKIDEKCA